MPTPLTTPDDRAHFCSYDEARAACPDDIPAWPVTAGVYAAVNVTTGHRIECADVFMATGYAAGSMVLFVKNRYAVELGSHRRVDVAAHPRFLERIRDPEWQVSEEMADRRVSVWYADPEAW